MQNQALEKEILECTDDKFNDLALKIFHFQCAHCAVYREWLQNCNIDPSKILSAAQIPFLPISFFKTKKMGFSEEHTGRYNIFESSSTSGSGVSLHFVPFIDWYEKIFRKTFELFYGKIEDYMLLALLPSYLDRPNSSLVYMAEKLMEKAADGSGFFNQDFSALHDALQTALQSGQKVILLGVTFALLDFAEFYEGPALKNTIIMETGGMKGRRTELTRSEVHLMLQKSFGSEAIHSEYGMTELMSQAYSSGNGIFKTPPWMRISAAEINDPFGMVAENKTGRLCMTDLGNLYSCSFIATDDLARIRPDGSFEVMGRFDFSDTRGCNLMWE
ncbi:MAG: acyl transferase [Bacteroidetes bacterium]|nr:acyl transferase [Bacteroidota bacterium]